MTIFNIWVMLHIMQMNDIDGCEFLERSTHGVKTSNSGNNIQMC